MTKYLVAHEGMLVYTCTVLADNEVMAAVKYYEVARACNQEIGVQGAKEFLMGTSISNLKIGTIFHWADLDGTQWLKDVNPIENWIKYGM